MTCGVCGRNTAACVRVHNSNRGTHPRVGAAARRRAIADRYVEPCSHDEGTGGQTQSNIGEATAIRIFEPNYTSGSRCVPNTTQVLNPWYWSNSTRNIFFRVKHISCGGTVSPSVEVTLDELQAEPSALVSPLHTAITTHTRAHASVLTAMYSVMYNVMAASRRVACPFSPV